MRVAILSDTHLRRDAVVRLAPLRQALGEVDHIIHAGDFASPEALAELRSWGTFTGVWGNVDDDAVRAELPERAVVELAGYRIGVIHGHGDRGTTAERAYGAFRGETVDVVVFGHSHQPLIQTRDRVLLLNPGSALDKRRERWFSWIVLEFDAQDLRARLQLCREMG